MGTKIKERYIIILSRDNTLYATRRLYEEFCKKGYSVLVINPSELVCRSAKASLGIYYRGNLLHNRAVVIPRISQMNLDYILSVVRQFELCGFKVLNPSFSIYKARDKYACLMELASKRLEVVPTLLIKSSNNYKLVKTLLGDLPVVVKTTRSMGGFGTILVENEISLRSSMQIIWNSWQDTIVQKFMINAQPTDYRIIVLDSKVIGSAKRTGSDDFRTNLHQGGSFHSVILNKSVYKIAIDAVKIVGLKLGAVDLIEYEGKFYILEVNSSPGFEGMEGALGRNIVMRIVNYCAKLIK
ncbi:MAG: RimK family alpha-L-glutamate ligase [Planctomycetes bacterium]|nr:RimK family alpha-L-glutamate ligase [Planctomycetota bacterium]